MKIEALTLFSSFSSPIFRTRNVLKGSRSRVQVEVSEERGCGLPAFTPYPSKVPWHTGSRGVLSKLFPRYGNYCGPNYSSGRDSGSLVWDKGPIDALDYCCYQHDMGYDGYDQADLHRADIIFLDCLESIPREGRKPGSLPMSEPYRNLYIFGVQTVLIPYRKYLLQNLDAKTQRRLTMEEKAREN